VKVSIDIKSNKLPSIAAQLPEAADAIINGTHGPRMQEAARRHSRVDTGRMRDGWQWQKTGQGTGQLTNDVEYTIFHEFGTRVISAAPMARPALAEIGPDIERDFGRLETMLR